jgi:POT family proton-dependent oligopeptide transporter
MALCYGTTLVGGYITSKGLGVRNAAVLGGILTVLGLACVLVPSEDLCFVGLALVSMGSGFFKPSLLTAVGLTFENPKDPGKDKAYSLVYVTGNIGIFAFIALWGFVGEAYGYSYGILLTLGIFAAGTYLVHKSMRFHPSHEAEQVCTLSFGKLSGIVASLVAVLYLLFKYRDSFHGVMGVIGFGSLAYLAKITYQCTREERKGILIVLGHILLFTLFVILFEQSGSSLLLFMEKAVDREVMGNVFPSPSLLSLGALFVIVCSPPLLILSKRLERTKLLGEFTKPGFGFLFAALSFCVLAWATRQNFPVPLFWVIGAMLLQTFAELWIAPISLSKISQHSPTHLQSVMMSFWTMAIAYGHYFAGLVAQFSVSATPEGSLNQYRTFFLWLGLAAFAVGAVVLLIQKVGPCWFRGVGMMAKGGSQWLYKK